MKSKFIEELLESVYEKQDDDVINPLLIQESNNIDLDISNFPNLKKGEYVIFNKKDWQKIQSVLSLVVFKNLEPNDKKEITKLGNIKAIPLIISKS